MQSINERIVALRKALNLSQRVFGEKVGATRDIIGNIEYGNTDPKPLLLNQIIKEYPVNREWLMTGKGEMLRDTGDEEEFSRLFDELLKLPESSFRRRLIAALAKLSPEDWAQIEAFARSLLAEDEEKERKEQNEL